MSWDTAYSVLGYGIAPHWTLDGISTFLIKAIISGGSYSGNPTHSDEVFVEEKKQLTTNRRAWSEWGVLFMAIEEVFYIYGDGSMYMAFFSTVQWIETRCRGRRLHRRRLTWLPRFSERKRKEGRNLGLPV
jgi:hypothetical protein